MANVFDNPELRRSLEQANEKQKESTRITEKLNSEMDSTKSKLEDLGDSIDKNKFAQDREAKTSFKRIGLTQKSNELIQQQNQAREELTVQQTEVEQFNVGKQLDTSAVFKTMNENIFKISQAELDKRREFDAQMKIDEEILANLKQTNPEATAEIAVQEKNLALKKEKEDDRRENASTNMFQKGFKGVVDGLKGIKETAKATAVMTLKGGLLIAAYFAFAKFLQSPMFGKVIEVVKEIAAGFKAIFDYIMKPGGIFDGLKRAFGGVLDILTSVFGIITGIFTGDGQKILEGFRGIFAGLAEVIGGIGEAIFSIIKDLAVGLVNLVVGIVKGIFNAIVDAVTGVFNFINDLFGGFFDPIANMYNQFFGGFKKIFEGDILGGLADIILAPFRAVGEMAANAFRFILDKFAYILNFIPGVNINVDDFLSGGAPDVPESPEPPQFLKDLQGPTLADRAGALAVREQGTQYVVQNNTSNNVVGGSTTQQINSTRYAKDQSTPFQSNNA